MKQEFPINVLEVKKDILIYDKDSIEDFEEVGEANFGSKINKIDWKGMSKKAGIIIMIIIILVIILK